MERFVFDVNFDEEFKILTHPHLKDAGSKLREELLSLDFTAHYALFSSGTSSKELKGYVLSEKALNINAEAVNTFFGLTKDDVWGLSLPVYHVGGLSVLIRARLLGNKVIDLRKWDPLPWHKTLSQEQVTITTIVPTQLYDLVKLGLKSPASLKRIIVGGDFLPAALEMKARDLGWPVIRTYGMTEVGSQLASGGAPGDKLQILPLHKVRLTPEGLLQVKTPSLFTAVFTLGEKLSIKFARRLCDQDDYYTTQDLVTISNNFLTPRGRINQEIKVAGHLTSLLSLKDSLGEVLLRNDAFGKAEILVEADERKGNRLILAHSGISDELIQNIRNALSPAVIDEVRMVTEFHRTDLGKLKLN